MPASLHRLQTKRARLDAAEADQLRQHILDFDAFSLPADAATAIVLAIDRATAAHHGWTFVMLSPAQNLAVLRWLTSHSKRPSVGVIAWGEILNALRNDTGEVMLTREELAARCEVSPNAITDALAELEGIGAITRTRRAVAGMRGRGRVVIHVNPMVATKLAGAARDRAQAEQKPVDTTGWTRGKGAVRHLVLKTRV